MDEAWKQLGIGADGGKVVIGVLTGGPAGGKSSAQVTIRIHYGLPDVTWSSR